MIRKLTIFMAVLALASTGFAVTLSQGTQELVVEGEYDPDTAAGDRIELSVSYGQFIQDAVEVGVRAGITDDDVVERWNIGVFGDYNVDMGNEMVPFAGASVNYANAEVGPVDDDAIVVGAQGGVKYFIAENIAISVAVLFEWATEDIFADDGSAEDTNVSVPIGMRFFF